MNDSATARGKMREGSDSDWLHRIEDLGDAEGYYEPLGARHHALFADRGPVLLVTFESLEAVRAHGEEELPLGFTLAESVGHSSLTLISQGETWFRDRAVYAYLDRLVDEAFFEDFDRVVFYGAGAGGYAATAFSVVAPGATVIALAPQATLDPRIAGWDARHREMRRTSFTDRYGFAPEMIEGAGAAWVIFDPRIALDAMHAALFARPPARLLPCRNLGENGEMLLSEIDLIEQMLVLACAGEFDAMAFWRLWRARRNSPRYLRHLLGQLEAADAPLREALVCRNAVDRLNGPRFRARLAALENTLQDQGIALPARAQRQSPISA